MGRIGKILSFLRVNKKSAKVSEVKINQSGGNNITCEHFEDAGSDSFPLYTDYAAILGIDRSGGLVAVGYLDPLTEKKAQIGEKRIYARRIDGSVICEIHLKNNGEVEIKNDIGNFKLLESGEFNINGARITTDGDIVTASGVSLDKHYHTQDNDSDGDSEADTSESVATE
jgi:hypothetical protein